MKLTCSAPALLIASLLAPLPAIAQQPSRTIPYLERVAWSPQERGPLLVVAPDARIVQLNGDHAPNYSLLPSEGGLNVLDVSEVLERKRVHVGATSALVPQKTRQLNTNLGKPDISQLDQADALVALVVSLSDRQRKLLSSSVGLGQRDLGAQQQLYFARILPKTLRSTARMVPERALAQAQLHLNRTLQLSFAFEDPNLSNVIGFQASRSSASTLTRAQEDGPAKPFGRVLLDLTDNQAKASPLNYRSVALDRGITLEGATTVSELLARVSLATQQTILADRRIGQLPIWQRSATGQTVRAGDLLQTLAWSVAGTFRPLQAPNKAQVWLLTDDVEGLATRLERQRLWLKGAEGQVEEQRKKWREKIKPLATQELTPLDNFVGLSEDAIQQLRNSPPHTQKTFPVSVLSPEFAPRFQEAARQQDAEMKAGKQTYIVDNIKNPPLTPDRVSVQFGQSQLHWEIPGYGTYTTSDALYKLDFELQFATYIRTAPPSSPVPPRPIVKTRIVLFAPKTENEARQAVRAAAEAKLSAVWMVTEISKLEVLKAALDEGKKSKVAVGAHVALARLPDETPVDLTVLGEAGPYKVPDAPETLPALLPLLRSLATLTGLAGLAFSEIGPPGYGNKSKAAFWTTENNPMGYGYTLARRLSFLGTDGYDPVDVARDDYAIGFLRNLDNRVPDALDRWNAARYQANVALLTQVFTALKITAPTLPLWLKSRSEEPNQAWFGSWDKPDSLPSFTMVYAPSTDGEPPLDPFDAIPQARHSSREMLFTRPLARFSEEDKTPLGDIWSFMLSFEQRNSKTFPWDGTVLDLTALPMEKALATLQEVKP